MKCACDIKLENFYLFSFYFETLQETVVIISTMKIFNSILILSLLTVEEVALRDRRSLLDNFNSGFKIPGKVQFVY